MASHPHPHHQNHPPTTTCCCTTSYSSCHRTQSHHPHYSPPPPPQPHSDPLLLQAIASHLLQSNPPPHSDPYLPKPHKSHHHPKPHKSHIHQQQQLHTLVSRIEALEASLHHSSSSSSSRNSRSSNSYSSLRDYAARVIQTHFRSFLVRRSRTLRQLKDLAFIKSSFASLKSSISNRAHFDFHSVSQKALALLLRLESIQCGDPIVRDGKRSMSRDLVKFLELIEGLVVKRQGVLLKQVKKNVRPVRNVTKSNRVVGNKCGGGGGLGRDQREMIGKLRDRIEKIRGFAKVSENDEEDVEFEGFQHHSEDEDEEEERVGQCRNEEVMKRSEIQPKVKKTVSFAENDVFRVFSSEDDEQGSSGDGSDSSDDHGERVENCSEGEDVKGSAREAEVDVENGGSAKTSYAERKPRARMTQRRDHGQGDNEYLLFSPPLPVKMDSREDVAKGDKGVKIVTSN